MESNRKVIRNYEDMYEDVYEDGYEKGKEDKWIARIIKAAQTAYHTEAIVDKDEADKNNEDYRKGKIY